MSELQDTIVIGGDTSDAEQAIARVESAVNKMAGSATRAGQQTADGMSKIGDGADVAAQKLDKATRQLIGQLQRTDAEMAAGGTKTSRYFEERARQVGANMAAIEPYLVKLRAQEQAQQRVGISAGQMAAAMRGVPAQMTDIVVSLSSGQNAMTVLLQQGGQLKDMFGGIGNAASALASQAMRLINPWTLTAGAVLSVGAALVHAGQRQREFADSLAIGGNALGLTVGKLEQLHASVGKTTGNFGDTAEALNLIVRSGKVTADNLGVVTTSVVRLSQATGRAIKDVAKDFTDIGRDPLKVAQELSEKYGTVTFAVYQQAQALIELGKRQEAVNLLQLDAVKNSDKLAETLEKNKGIFERYWTQVKANASNEFNNFESLIDRMVNGPGAQEKIAALGTEIETLTRRLESMANNPALSTSPMQSVIKQQIENLRAQQDALKGTEAAQAAVTAAESKARDVNDRAMAAQRSYSTELSNTATNAEKLRLKLTELAKARGDMLAAPGADAAKINADFDRLERAARQQLQPKVEMDRLLDALAMQESGGRQFDRNGNVITSRTGALGMYQIQPQYGPEFARLAGVDWNEQLLRTDPEYGRKLAKAFVEKLMRDFDGNLEYALTAYNQGAGGTRKAISRAAANGGDFRDYLGPDGKKYANSILGRFDKDFQGNLVGGPKINEDAIRQAKELRDMQDATRSATAALAAEQAGYNKTMAAFIGLQATDKWQAMNEAQRKAQEQSAVAKSNLDAQAESFKAMDSATQGASAAWDAYNAVISKTAGYTSEMAAEQARYDKLISDSTKNALTQETLQKVQREHLATMAALREKDAVQQAAALAKQADGLEEANKYYGLSAIAIGEMQKARLEDAAAAEFQANGSTKLAQALSEEANQRGRVNEAMRVAAANQLLDSYKERARSAQEQLAVEQQTYQLAGLTGVERAKATIELERHLRLKKDIAEIDRKGLTGEQRERAIEEATTAGIVEAQARVAKAVNDEWSKTADSINQSLTDALLRGFEGGKDFAKNFKDTLMNMFKTLVLRPVISFIVQPIGNAISGIVSGLLGGGQGAAGGGLGGMVSNGSSLLNLFGGGVGGNMGAISGFFGGGMSFGNAAGSIAANSMAGAGMYGGNSLSAFLATNGAYGTSGAAAGVGGLAAGLAVVAAPLIIGALAESRTRDRFSGAAFATSNFAKDPTVTIGGAEYDPIKGILPDREALVGRALEAGISQDMIDRFKDKDRALLHYIRMLDSNRQSGNEGPPINVNALLENDNMYAADWYRGQGYAHPEAMGWWNDKGYDLNSNDPAVTSASRAVATSIVGPLTEINRILGGAADDFRVTAGYATRGDGKGVWAGLNVSQGGNSLVDWVNMDDFHSPQEAVKGMYEQALGALEKLDLPKWAQEQVDGAQAAMAGIKGDKMGEEAAALYAQTAGSIAQTISAIKMLIDVFPDFANATQDSVHALAELMGGMDNLQSAYSTYIGAFWSEGERQALMTAQLTAQLAELGQTMPTTAEGFRRMVEDALAAGESGNALAAALLGMSGAMAQVLGQTQAVAFGASQELAGAIQSGLLGTFDGENLGAFMAQTVSDGIYNAIAGGFATKITDIIVQGVINPAIQAAMVGSSVSAAVSAASIEAMVAQAQAVAQAAATVLNDPAIRAAIGSIASAVASIKVPAMSAAPQYVSSYTDAVRDSGRAADDAAREAERLADAWRSIGDTLIDEVNRIRGVVADAGGNSLSYYQSLFAVDTAAARAGDQDAAGRLAGLSGDLLRAAEAQAGSLFDLQAMRAWVAQSLQDTAGYAYAKAGGAGATPAPVPAPSPAMFGLRTAQQDNGTRELNQQIAVLTEQNQRQAAQLADLQLQLLRVFRRWDDEGMPPQREEDEVTP